MKVNKHVQVIPQEILAQVQTKINEVKTLLAFGTDFEDAHGLFGA